MVVRIIYYILFSITIVYALYFALSGFIGIIMKSKVKFKKASKYNNFAIIIAARNEAKVIGNLLESLNSLDYPKDKYKVYVVPNNCTDNTKEIALQNHAEIVDCNIKVTSKGDVLKHTFETLKSNSEIDAYIIFDADNVVHKNFLNKMNDCLESGFNVAQGYRDAKNPSDNWLSGSYAIFYLFQNVFFNRARMSFNASSSINGTGFMIKKSLIDEKGFDTKSLTEDVEFTGQCALANEKIAFVEDAITYDEYPVRFVSSWKQRKRWSAGIITCMKLYSPKLFVDFIKTGNISSLDMSLVYLGPLMQVLSFINFIILIIFKILGIELYDIFSYAFATGFVYFIILYLLGILIEIFTVLYKRKNVFSIMSGVILFLVFTFTWIPINIICFIKKYKKWEEIKHDRSIKIEELKLN